MSRTQSAKDWYAEQAVSAYPKLAHANFHILGVLLDLSEGLSDDEALMSDLRGAGFSQFITHQQGVENRKVMEELLKNPETTDQVSQVPVFSFPVEEDANEPN